MGHRSRLRLHSVEGIPNRAGGVGRESQKVWWRSKPGGCDVFLRLVAFFLTPVVRCVSPFLSSHPSDPLHSSMSSFEGGTVDT